MEMSNSSAPDYPEIILERSWNSERHKIKRFTCNLKEDEKGGEEITLSSRAISAQQSSKKKSQTSYNLSFES